jgi:hypothetical protein
VTIHLGYNGLSATQRTAWWTEALLIGRKVMHACSHTLGVTKRSRLTPSIISWYLKRLAYFQACVEELHMVQAIFPMLVIVSTRLLFVFWSFLDKGIPCLLVVGSEAGASNCFCMPSPILGEKFAECSCCVPG